MYRYNASRHQVQITVNDRYPAEPWEVAIYSSNSGRKLKVLARCKSRDVAKIYALAARSARD